MQEKHCSLVIVCYKSRLLSLARNSQPLMSFCTHSEGPQMPSFRTKKLNIKINVHMFGKGFSAYKQE